MRNSTVTFENYLGPILQLHPNWCAYTLDAADEQRAIFAAHSNEEKLLWFPEDFQAEVRSLFDDHNSSESLSQKIAISIYNLHLATGAPYRTLESKLQEAFGKQLSKSYFSKLLSAGELLTKRPELQEVKDLEKLAILAQVEDDSLLTEITEQNKVASMSRSLVRRAVDEKLGRATLIVVTDSNVIDINGASVAPQTEKSLRAEVSKKLSKLNFEQLSQVDQLITSFLARSPDSTSEVA